MAMAQTNTRRINSGSVSLLLAFIIVVVAVGIGIGCLTAPGDWYESLRKPVFNPPPWVFGPVWTVLYILIAVAGWRIWEKSGRSGAMLVWSLQMALNWLWSPIFFGARMPWLAFGIIVTLFVTIVAFIVKAKHLDRLSAWLFVPYAIWVAFATLLNGFIAAAN
jgi:translocator protein